MMNRNVVNNNLLGQLVKMTDPMGYTETYTYDAAGNIATSKDKNGATTTYTYDSRNRLLSKTKGGKSESYTYDSVGNALTQTNENGTITLEYYTDGTLKRKTMPDGKTISYTYDVGKKVTSMTDYFGQTTSYTYTGGSYIDTITTEYGSLSYCYRKDGQPSASNGGGNITDYLYDNLGRQNGLWPGGGSIVTYTYDNSGNITRKIDAGVTTTYTYDDVNRLVQEKPGSSSYFYEYDKYNNMTLSMTDTDKTYTYDTNNRLTDVEEYVADDDNEMQLRRYVFDYDANGNMLIKDCRLYDFDTNQLLSIYYGDFSYNVWGQLTSSTVDEIGSNAYNTGSYAYYADGTRKSKVVSEHDNGTTTNTYNYYYNGDTVINETKNGTNYATNLIGRTGIEGRNQNGTTGFFVKDMHGDVRYAFNASQIKIADYTYTAWGNEKTTSTSDWATENPIRYNGQYLDNETGFYYLRARYYDPSIHRFTSEDPAEDGINWYAYCGNNPVNRVDPSGENYDDIIKNLAIIYKSKNIMNANEASTVEYADAYDEAIKAKSEIENDEFYIHNYSDLKKTLCEIIKSDDNSIDSIRCLIDTVTQMKKDDRLNKTNSEPTIVSVVGGSILMGIDALEAMVQAVAGGVTQKNIDDVTSNPTPMPTPVPVGPPEDIEDIQATINFN